MSGQNYNGQIAEVSRGNSEVKASFGQSMGDTTKMNSTYNERTIQNSAAAQSAMQSKTADGFIPMVIDREAAKQRAAGAGRGSKSAARDKRYGKRSNRNSSQIYAQYQQPSAPAFNQTHNHPIGGPKSVGGRRKRSVIVGDEAYLKTPQRTNREINTSLISKGQHSQTTAWAEAQLLTRPKHQKNRSQLVQCSPDGGRKISSTNSLRARRQGNISVSVRSTFHKGSTTSSKQIPMYLNVTGPGDYDIPGFTSKFLGEAESGKRTFPAYSLAPKTKQPYWPSYDVDFKGQDSPGMNKYNPKTRSVNEQSPIFSIQKATRFTGIEERNREQLKNVPQYEAKKSEFENKSNGFSISTGKCWTLKITKDDETTPGPVYETQHLNSMTKKVEMTDELKNGSFGAYRDKQRTIPTKGFEKAYLGSNSPGPSIYGSMEQAKVKAQLSVTRNSQKFSVPRQERFQVPKKPSPSPATYQNTNEVSNKMTMRRNGQYSIPRQARRVDFTKYSALHSSLVSKGYY